MTFQNFKTAPRGRQAAENTMKTDGGVMDEAAEATTELDCFKLFMDESIITDVTELTNRNIQGHLDKLSPEKLKMIQTKNVFIRVTTEEEVLAYLGLMYMRGCYQWNYWDVQRVWATHPIFSATMSINRFWFLSRFFVMDDTTTREDRYPTDKFAAVRDIFERWNENCGCALQMGDYGDIKMFVIINMFHFFLQVP